MVDTSNAELWELPREGMLRFELICLELRAAAQPGTLSLVRAALGELPSDRDRLQLLRIVFDGHVAGGGGGDGGSGGGGAADDVFWLTCAMALSLIEMFEVPESQRAAFDIVHGYLVDVQNALDIEEHVHATFGHLDQPISHSMEVRLEHRMSSI